MKTLLDVGYRTVYSTNTQYAPAVTLDLAKHNHKRNFIFYTFNHAVDLVVVWLSGNGLVSIN